MKYASSVPVFRYYYIFNKYGEEFTEWLRGFKDSQGSFYIELTNKGRSFRFNFQIELHIDDTDTLHFINKKLGLGEVRDKGTKVIFTIRAKEDIVKIIDILSINPLNTKKNI